ncbi:hypothetical protein DPEC_G00105920 [Dallia pectoralis]|uniref:Uncharacterized protein n=1 Tax=Dallia pectoralis TaxID=75939 RepID=A0ACC2GY53_DALPE|nr:hypothetical protein DPEC_G00105920 [Dallia pectoralis]
MISSNHCKFSLFCCCCSVESREISTHVNLERSPPLCFNSRRRSGHAHRMDRSRRKLPPAPPENDEGGVLQVVAMYDFTPQEDTDLSLVQGEYYTILHKQDQLWWRVQDKHGNKGFIPSNYVTEKDRIEANQWYCHSVTRSEAEQLLRQEGKEGGFVVRESSQKGCYTVSLFTKALGINGGIRHYQIKLRDSGRFYLCLVTRLRYPVGPAGRLPPPATPGFSSEKWEINPSELTLMKEVGSGQYGVVCLGKWRAQHKVAIKTINEGAMLEEDFIEEAKIMMRLCHPKLVQLYGVCTQQRPMCIVTEFLDNGCLLNYLRQGGSTSRTWLLSACQDACEGMEYLETHSFIHRDLAARNCLVSDKNVVKVCDFGMTRYVLDNQYTSSTGSKFPVKWSPPEVLHYNKYSSKSDIWSFGVLMWEVFSEGKTPYDGRSNIDVVEDITSGHRLYRPQKASSDVYQLMYKCWHEKPQGRPSFSELLKSIRELAELENTRTSVCCVMENYENLGLVGEGSYGTVMKCRHKENGRIVAVKKFLESEDDKTVKKIALREIKMLRHLRHENLVNLLEVWKKRRRWYLVFEFVERTVLDDLERSQSGLDYSHLRRYLYQILRAVSFCHQHNIIHRDIKPENILVSQGGVVKLCDFGFARTMAAPGENYTDYVATRWYRAPELLVGDTKYGKAVDVWAVGCLCVEMLTGEPLFPGDSDIDQLYLIIRSLGNLTPRHKEFFYKNPVFSGVSLPEVSEREPLEYRYPKISATTRDLTKKCLQMDPNRRPQCADLLQHQMFTNDGFHLRFIQELTEKIQRDQKESYCLPKMIKNSKMEKDEKRPGNNKDSGRTPVKTSEYSSIAKHTKSDATTPSKPRELFKTPSDSKPRELFKTPSDSKPRNTTLTISKPQNTTVTDSKPRNTTLTISKPRNTTLTDSEPRDLDKTPVETTTVNPTMTTTIVVKTRREEVEKFLESQAVAVKHSQITNILTSAMAMGPDRTEENQPVMVNPGPTVGPNQDQPPIIPPLLHTFTHTPSNNTFTHTPSLNTLATITHGNGLISIGNLGEVGPYPGTISLRSLDKAKKHMNLFSRISQQSLSSPLTCNLTPQMISEKSVIHERSFLSDRVVGVGQRKPDVMRSEFHFPELKPPLLPELRGAEGKQIKACNKEQTNDRHIPSITDTHTHNNTHQRTHTPPLNHTTTHTNAHTHHL